MTDWEKSKYAPRNWTLPFGAGKPPASLWENNAGDYEATIIMRKTFKTREEARRWVFYVVERGNAE